MAEESGQRTAAIGLRDTLGKVAQDSSEATASFHEVTAATSRSTANALRDTDEGLGSDMGGMAEQAPASTSAHATGGPAGEGEGGGVPSGDGVDDDFTGGDEGGNGSEGSENTEGASDPVDVVSGQMITSETDVRLPGVLALVLRRSYASGYRHGALFGPGWSSTLDQRLVVDADGAHFLGDDVQTLNFPLPARAGEVTLPAAGARWELTFDAQFDVYTVRDPVRGLRYLFPVVRERTRGRDVRDLARIEDRCGNWIEFTRDGLGAPSSVACSGGYRLEVDSSAGRIGPRVTALRLCGPGEERFPICEFDYDRAGRLVGVVDCSGEPFCYEYDELDRITAWISRLGYRYEYSYDRHGRVVRGSGPEGYLSAEFDYDPDRRTTTAINALGERTVYRYDEHRHITAIVDPLGRETLFAHDRYGRETERTDPLGGTTVYRYDERGDLAEVGNPDGTRVIARYNDHHQVVEAVDETGASWTYGYDEHGSLAWEQDPVGARTDYTYTDRGRLAAVTDAEGNTSRFETDAAGLALALTDPLGATSRTERDAFGRAVALTDPLGYTTRLGWSVRGEAVWRQTPDGAREHWEYDADGNEIEHLGLAGARTRYTYGPTGLRTTQTLPDGARYALSYDAERNLREITGPTGLVWHYEYEPGGQLARETDFNGRVTMYEYDDAGRLIGRVNGAGQRVDIVRDERGRPTRRRVGQEETIVYQYDPAGRLLSARSETAAVEYAYDAAGHVLLENADGRHSTYAYSAVGLRIERTTPSGTTSFWSYDANGAPTALASDTGSLSMSYDRTGREISRVVGTGAAISRTYTADHRLAALGLWSYDRPADGSAPTDGYRLLSERTYRYRDDGRPLAITDSAQGVTEFELDPVGRVTARQADSGREQYDYAHGGALQRALWPDGDSAESGSREYCGTLLVAAGRTRYEYDGQGRTARTVKRTLSGRRDVFAYTWDADDRLTSIAVPDGTAWHYRYDALGRRTGKQHRAADGSVLGETVFTWDGTRLAEQARTLADGTVETLTWDFEPGTDRVAAQTRRVRTDSVEGETLAHEFHAVVTDHVGTPTELLSPAGHVAWQSRAGLWGQAVGRAGHQDVPFPLGFPGQYRDEESGLSYNYVRYYDPAVGRYLTPDPLGLFPAPDDYGYVANPTAEIDPLGLWGKKNPDNVSPHYADVRVYDKDGNVKYAYTLRSGNRLPQELALGDSYSIMASHTEARAMRMHGVSPTVPIPGDPLANLMPVQPGDRIEINGINSPCSQCKGYLNRAVKELGVSAVYNWGGNSWTATG
jgi:RHS repeat-associated protein